MVLKRRDIDFKKDFEVNFNGARLFDPDRYVEDIKRLPVTISQRCVSRPILSVMVIVLQSMF